MRPLRPGRIVSIIGLCSLLGLGACGARQEGAGGEGDETAASAMLASAREDPSADRYRRVFEKYGATRAGGIAREELGTLKLAEARNALEVRDFGRADDAAEEARTYGTEEQTGQALALLDAIDDGRAQAVTEEVTALAGKEGGCLKGCAAVVAPLAKRPRPRPRFKASLHTRSAPVLLACVGAQLEARFREGGAEAARKVLVTPEVTVALAPADHAKAAARLAELVVARTLEELAPLLGERKWAEALAEVARRREGGALEAKESDAVLAAVRERLRADVLQRIEAARAKPKPSREAPAIHEIVKLARWEPVPEDVARALAGLGRSLECEKVRCVPEKPAQVWAWGALPLASPDGAVGAATARLEHGQAVYRVGRAGARALVATADPGAATGAALLDVAAGWVDAARLRPASTADWLPPPELLTSVRVWGPLREGAREYSLGIVTSADAKRAVVRRLADSLEITVDTKLLRLGTVPVGMKVLAFCVDRIHAEPAKIDGAPVLEGTVEKVPVICERGALAHVELMSALGADPAWLPPKKP